MKCNTKSRPSNTLLEKLCSLLAIAVLCTLTGCGGSDDIVTAGIDGSGKDPSELGAGEQDVDELDAAPGANGGFDGSGIIASGPIRDFGSIILEGGLCFDLADAEITIDGRAAEERDLLLGYFVTVAGDLGHDENCGTADRVIYETYLRGPIKSIEASEGGEYKVINVLNKVIIVSRSEAETIFGAGITFDTLTVGQSIAVSGRLLDGEVLLTTRLDLLADTDNIIQFPSTVVAIDGNLISVADGFAVDILLATRTGFGEQDLEIGQLIDIQGTLRDITTIAAMEITLRTDTNQLDTFIGLSQALTVKGETSDFSTNALTISDIAVNTENASVFPSFIPLKDGLSIEATGNYANNTLSASSIVIQRLYEEGIVLSIDDTAQQVTLRLERYGETITIDATTDTLVDDNRNGIVNITLADLDVGDLVAASLLIGESQRYDAQSITRIAAFTGATTTDPAAILIDVNVTSLYPLADTLFVQNFTQSDTGTLEIVITDNGYGGINALETVNLSGNLIVTNSANAFAVGDEYDLFQGQIQGTFTTITLPELDTGLNWDLSRFYQNGVMRVVQSPPMPL